MGRNTGVHLAGEFSTPRAGIGSEEGIKINMKDPPGFKTCLVYPRCSPTRERVWHKSQTDDNWTVNGLRPDRLIKRVIKSELTALSVFRGEPLPL